VLDYKYPLDNSYLKEKEHEWMSSTKHLNDTPASLKTTYDSPIGIEVSDNKRIEQFEKDKEYLKEDYRKLSNKIDIVGNNNHLKRLEKLEHNISNLANSLGEWSVQTSKVSSY